MAIGGITRRALWGSVFLALLAHTVSAQAVARIEPLSIVTDTTATLFSAEIADTDELRERGLMFRHVLPQNQAMLFDFGKPRPAAMWMKNTYISLDMLFVRLDGTIAALAENTEPFSTTIISVEEPVKGVVELPSGTIKRLGIKRDDKVYHEIFKTVDQ